MALWKDIGITYTRFSQVAASALRNCKKGIGADLKKDTELKITQWDGGKAQK